MPQPQTEHPQSDQTWVLVTGAAQRIGAAICRHLHQKGYALLLHYRSSRQAADELAAELNALRADSCQLLSADLCDAAAVEELAEQAKRFKLFGLVNNASSFYPTPAGSVSLDDWDALIGPNLRAPLFLSHRLADTLAANQGAIVNITDIHAERPLEQHSVYCAAKAGLLMLTQSMAQELGPDVRVNAVAPGAILWPGGDSTLDDESTQAEIMRRTPLGQLGRVEDIAGAVGFLLDEAPYVSGQVIRVDGGRSTSI